MSNNLNLFAINELVYFDISIFVFGFYGMIIQMVWLGI